MFYRLWYEALRFVFVSFFRDACKGRCGGWEANTAIGVTQHTSSRLGMVYYFSKRKYDFYIETQLDMHILHRKSDSKINKFAFSIWRALETHFSEYLTVISMKTEVSSMHKQFKNSRFSHKL